MEINNKSLKEIYAKLGDESWLQGLYGSEKADQQAKLKGLFSMVSDNDATASDKLALEAKAETIQDKVERLEVKMAALEEEMSKNQAKINNAAKGITDLVLKAEDQTEAMNEHYKEVTEMCIKTAFGDMERHPEKYGYQAFPAHLRELINKYIDPDYKEKLNGILDDLDAQEGKVSGLVSMADKWIAEKNLLKSQYGATKSTYDLLQASINQIGATETTYTNNDYNAEAPVYTPAKAETVSKLSDAYFAAPTNDKYEPGKLPPSVSQIENCEGDFVKYEGLFKTEPTETDKNTYANDPVENLGKALEYGLMNDLRGLGLTGAQVQEFLVNNFAGANIKKTDSGISIPYGHGQQAKEVFTRLTNEVKNYNSYNDYTSFLGIENKWDENVGNTINSNKQIKSLSENYGKILETMNAAGFTFKEAMYALFDPEKGIFKDSGVSYNKDKQGTRLNYFIEYAGDEETAKMYKGLSDSIYNLWGVKPSCGITSEQYDEPGPGNPTEPPEPPTGPTPTSPSRTDPIWFSFGESSNEKFSFIIDRDGDGKFSGKDEFAGALTQKDENGNETNTWVEDLLSFDKDGNGILEDDELKDVKFLGTNYVGEGELDDNHEYTPDEVELDKDKYNRDETTTVNYSIRSAESLGITSIDLSAYKNGTLKTGQTDGKTDINDSQIFTDSFNMTVEGQDAPVTAHRQDETDAFMETIYSDAYGKNLQLGLNDTDIEAIFNKDYGEYNSFENAFGGMFGDINILKNAGDIADNTRLLADADVKRIEDEKTVSLLRADQKASSTVNQLDGWSTMRTKLITAAANAGITTDSDFWEQTRGMYALDGTLSAEQIVENYKNQIEFEKNAPNEAQKQREIWGVMIKAIQAGVPVGLEEIKDKLAEGKTPDEIVEELKVKFSETYEKDTRIDIELDEREQEIYDAFNEVFKGEDVVIALAELCKQQQQTDRSGNFVRYMHGKTGKDLALDIMKKLGIEYQTEQ